MLPSSVFQMKLAAGLTAELGGLGACTGNVPMPPPGTTPVGPRSGPATPGNLTTVELAILVAGVIVDVFVPWFAGHQGEPAEAARPHGLIRFPSARSAGTNLVSLETRFRTTYRSLGAAD